MKIKQGEIKHFYERLPKSASTVTTARGARQKSAIHLEGITL